MNVEPNAHFTQKISFLLNFICFFQHLSTANCSLQLQKIEQRLTTFNVTLVGDKTVLKKELVYELN